MLGKENKVVCKGIEGISLILDGERRVGQPPGPKG